MVKKFKCLSRISLKSFFIGSLFTVISLHSSVSSAYAEGKPLFQSTSRQTILLELYTSEGCSSCPPAEAWLKELRKDPELWNAYVPVAFHVDYWNNLGWVDKLSSKEHTQRQRQYAKLWRTDTIYTPGFVLDGKAWRYWNRSDRVPIAPGEGAGILTVERISKNTFKVTYKEEEIKLDEWHAQGVLMDFDRVVKIRAGENAGKTLTHNFAVLDFTEIKLARNQKGLLEGVLSFPDESLFDAAGRGLAVWVTGEDKLVSVQIVGGYLPD